MFDQKINDAYDYLGKQIKDLESYKTAFVLGSGLSYLGSSLENKKEIAVKDIPNYPISTVMGHRGVLIFGSFQEKKIIILSGRVHHYEGYSYQDVIFPVKLLAKIGLENLILTNATGGINKSFKAGDLMLITDYFNNIAFHGRDFNKDEKKPRLSLDLNAKIERVARELGLALKKGIYGAMSGPSFETPAEIKFLSKIGVDVAGMSTVPAIITANNYGIEVAAISCITNLAAGISENSLTHEEVSETAEKVKPHFISLLKGIIAAV